MLVDMSDEMLAQRLGGVAAGAFTEYLASVICKDQGVPVKAYDAPEHVYAIEALAEVVGAQRIARAYFDTRTMGRLEDEFDRRRATGAFRRWCEAMREGMPQTAAYLSRCSRTMLAGVMDSLDARAEAA